jgi:Galactose mutarotase and related enzymes
LIVDQRGVAWTRLAVVALLNQIGCVSTPASTQSVPTVTRELRRAAFGRTADGQPVDLFILTNAHGIEVRLTNYGGIITSLKTPDRSGQLGDIVLGYDSLSGYLHDTPYFGAIVGRYGNRIARGRFTLDGTTYRPSTMARTACTAGSGVLTRSSGTPSRSEKKGAWPSCSITRARIWRRAIQGLFTPALLTR